MINLRMKLWAGYGTMATLLVIAGTSVVFDAPHIVTIFVLAGALVTGAACMVHVDSLLIDPLRQMKAMVERIDQGDLTPGQPVQGSHEVAVVSRGIQNLAVSMNQSRRLEAGRLHRLQASAQLAINALPHGVAVLSPAGVVELSNAVAAQLFGLVPGQIAGDGEHKWILPLIESASRTLAPAMPSAAGGTVQIFDGGRELFFTPRALPMIAESGVVEGITLLLVDGTEGRRVEEAQRSLVSTLSHELKTPLTSIQMCILLLLDDPGLAINPRQRELLAAARDDAERLHQMIGKVLQPGA